MLTEIKLPNGDTTFVECNYDRELLKTSCAWSTDLITSLHAMSDDDCPVFSCSACPFIHQNVPEEYSGEITRGKFMEYFETLKVEE